MPVLLMEFNLHMFQDILNFNKNVFLLCAPDNIWEEIQKRLEDFLLSWTANLYDIDLSETSFCILQLVQQLMNFPE